MKYNGKELVKVSDKMDGQNIGDVNGFYIDKDGLEFFIKQPKLKTELFTELFAGLIITEFKERKIIPDIYHDSLICAEALSLEDGSYALIQPKKNFEELYKLIGTGTADNRQRNSAKECFNGPNYYAQIPSLVSSYFGLSYVIFWALMLGNNSIHSGNIVYFKSKENNNVTQFGIIDAGASFRNYGESANHENLFYPYEYQGLLNYKSATKGYINNYRNIKGLFPEVALTAQKFIEEISPDTLKNIIKVAYNKIPKDLFNSPQNSTAAIEIDKQEEAELLGFKLVDEKELNDTESKDKARKELSAVIKINSAEQILEKLNNNATQIEINSIKEADAQFIKDIAHVMTERLYKIAELKDPVAKITNPSEYTSFIPELVPVLKHDSEIGNVGKIINERSRIVNGKKLLNLVESINEMKSCKEIDIAILAIKNQYNILSIERQHMYQETVASALQNAAILKDKYISEFLEKSGNFFQLTTYKDIAMAASSLKIIFKSLPEDLQEKHASDMLRIDEKVKQVESASINELVAKKTEFLALNNLNEKAVAAANLRHLINLFPENSKNKYEKIVSDAELIVTNASAKVEEKYLQIYNELYSLEGDLDPVKIKSCKERFDALPLFLKEKYTQQNMVLCDGCFFYLNLSAQDKLEKISMRGIVKILTLLKKSGSDKPDSLAIKILDLIKTDNLLLNALYNTYKLELSDTVLKDLLELKGFRDNKLKEKNGQDYDESINEFYKLALRQRLSRNSPKDQIKHMRAAAESQFHHRDKIKRGIADFFNFFTLIVGIVRYYFLNKTFFFSNAPTAREKDFNALINLDAVEKKDENCEVPLFINSITSA